ncbi:hypothetical protein [Shewanella sp. YIC-542]|uniref:hypothetical protein n=1 Tax=Shewanella mytili TaxID=3377111 RepID=UPI00398F1570
MSIQRMSLNNTPGLSQAVASNRPPASSREKVINEAVASVNDTPAAVVDPLQLDAKYQARVEYERELGASSGAISVYLLTQNADQREHISQMVGVDVYA